MRLGGVTRAERGDEGAASAGFSFAARTRKVADMDAALELKRLMLGKPRLTLVVALFGHRFKLRDSLRVTMESMFFSQTFVSFLGGDALRRAAVRARELARQTAANFHTTQATFVWDQYQKVVDETDILFGLISKNRTQSLAPRRPI